MAKLIRIIQNCVHNWIDYNTEWSAAPLLDEFIHCIDLKIGCIIIAIFGIIYGLIGLLYFLSIIIHNSDWKSVYEKKNDALAYFLSIFAIISILFFTNIMLLLATLTGKEILLRLYQWSVVLHIILNIVINISVCLHCLFNGMCFNNPPGGIIIGLMVVTIFYTIFWWYLIVTVNSYRMEL